MQMSFDRRGSSSASEQILPDGSRPEKLRRRYGQGILAQIKARSLAGERTWTIRVVTTHDSGREREARFHLNAAGFFPRTCAARGEQPPAHPTRLCSPYSGADLGDIGIR